MTQPDLVSKLRELSAKWREHIENRHDSRDSAEDCQGCQQLKSCADELESLLGLEGQAAEPEPQPLPDYCFECDDTSRCASAEICYAHHEGYPKIVTKPCGPSQPETEGEAGRQPVGPNSPSVQVGVSTRTTTNGPCYDPLQPSPSTPIVPGTAGLSEIGIVKAILSAHQTAYAKFHNGEGHNVIESDGMAIGYASVELAKLLSEREARIRKDVLEEAAVLAEDWANVVPNHDRGYPKRFGNAIRALAERPAPAGEVSKGEK